MNWRFFWDYSGGNVYENMCHQLAFWYKVMNLQIPEAVTMVGGIYLWKDGREVPDTMNVAMEHPEEILFTWDSGFGNSQLGSTEDVLGTDGTISKGQQIRYMPQKVNRPDGTEMLGATKTPPNAHMQNFLDCIRSGKETNCPFDVGFRVSIACRMAVDSYRQGRAMRWDAGGRRNRLTSVDFEYTPEQIQLRKSVREFAEAEILPARHGVGRGADLSARDHSQAGQARLHGVDLPRGIGRRGARIRRVLHHHRGAFARGWLGRNHRRRAHFAVLQPYFQDGERRAEEALSAEADVGRMDRLLVADGAGGGIGRRGDAHHGDARGRAVDHQRREDIHHQCSLRGCLRGDGGDGPGRRAARHFGVHHREGHARIPRREERNKLGLRASATGRGDLRRLPAAGVAASGQARRGLCGQPQDARWRTDFDCGAEHRDGAGSLRRGAEVFQGAQAVRPSDLRVSGDPAQAGGYGDGASTRRGC